MSKLTSFKLLSFDVYGTLIDWERGIISAMHPMLVKSNKPDIDHKLILKAYRTCEAPEQKANPTMKYNDLLAVVHPKVCKELGLEDPTQDESRVFGESVKAFPAWPDTVAALHRLRKTYKMVVLSNVDNASFAANNAASMAAFPWDLVLTAEEIGSYKPALRNFEHMLTAVKGEFGVEKDQVLQTAQSQFHDHHPAREMGIKSCWIYRPGSVVGNRDDPVWDWRFDTLGDMADAVEKELKRGE